MKKAKKTIIIVICIAVAIGLLCLLAAYVIVPMIAVLRDDIVVSVELDNPYVDSKFKGWQVISASDKVSYMIPEDWYAEYDGTFYNHYDSAGELIACGKLLDSPYSMSDFLNDMNAAENVNYSLVKQTPGIFSFHGETFGCYAPDGQDGDENVYCCVLSNEDSEYSLWLVLTQDIGTHPELIDIFGAMMYSAAFKC